MSRPVVTTLLAVAVLIGGCSIQVDEGAQALSDEGHEEVLYGTSTSTSTTVPDESQAFLADLYFVGGPDNKVEMIQRPYPADTIINDILADLERGPNADELDAFSEIGNLSTFLPAGLSPKLGGRDEERGVQLVLVDPVADLRQQLVEDPPSARLAVKQIVCTLLHLPSIEKLGLTGVEITDGEPIELTDDAAQPIVGPATLEDFGNCVTGSEERMAALLESEGQEDGSTTTSEPTGPGG